MDYSRMPSLDECLAAASDTKKIVLEAGALESVPAVFAGQFPSAAAFIVADGNTMAAAGDRVAALLERAGIPVAGTLVFPARPVLHAELELAGAVARAVGAAGKAIPVAVGAGTINDLTKRAAFELERPYLCVPTAASVDGFTSYGAALLSGGYKRTFPCPAPRAVVADTEVLAAAPPYLSSSGYGDLAGKLVAGSDWIIAEAAGRGGAEGWEPIEPLAWAMTQAGLGEALEGAADARLGDARAVGLLFGALAATGFSMQYLKSSRPVSGCEHLFSHVWEMGDLSVDGRPVTHGHKVAVGTLIAAAVTETLFASPSPPRRVVPPSSAEDREREVRSAFPGLPSADDIVATALSKLPSASAAERLGRSVADEWSGLRSSALARLPPYGELRAMLRRAGCPTRAEEIGLTRTEAIRTAFRAQMIRNRYTVLDLAWDLGVLETTLEKVEANADYLG
jgi:glycerol-1-phosphate dehydrogenase [NAD(P)+]